MIRVLAPGMEEGQFLSEEGAGFSACMLSEFSFGCLQLEQTILEGSFLAFWFFSRRAGAR